MDKPPIEGLAERVERLEQLCDRLTRANRLWKRIGAALVTAFAGVLILGADGGKVIEAERFVLRGKNKQELIRLEEIPDHGPALGLFDNQGRQRINLTLDADGKASMGFFDRDEAPRIGFGLQPDGLPGLSFIGHDGKERGGLSINADGSVAFGLFDIQGRPRLRFSSNADGTPHLTLISESGAKRLGLDVAPTGEAILSVLDTRGVPHLSMGMGRDGKLWQGVRDREGRFAVRAIEP